MHPDRQHTIRGLFQSYIEMYAGRDDRLTERFSQNFSGYTGSGDALTHSLDDWIKITRQDFAQVPGRIRIEMLDLSLQDLSDDVVMATASFHIHLPSGGDVLSKRVARLSLVFRLEEGGWMIVHSGISVPYQRAKAGEIYPLSSLEIKNDMLRTLVAERTQELHQNQELCRLLMEDTRDVLWMTDAQLQILYISPADERLRGFRADEVVGQNVFDMFTEEGVALVKGLIEQRAYSGSSVTPEGFLTFEVEHRCKDGRLIWGEIASTPVLDAQGKIIGYHGITREITQRKMLEEQVRKLAFHDTLTRLANRRLLIEHLEQAMSAGERSHHYGALLFLDLDNFKVLNDTHGHAMGDLLLIEVARRLKACVRDADSVARFGGDEFVVLLSELSTQWDNASTQAATIAEKIRVCLAEPYWLESAAATSEVGLASTCVTITHRCTASVGTVLFHGRDVGLNEVIEGADAAMYQSKTEGGNRVKFASIA